MTTPLILKVIRPFRRQAVGVAALVVLDTVLTSLGVGVVLPVFQALLDPQHRSTVVTDMLPFLNGLDPSTRLVALTAGTVLLFLVKAIIAHLALVATHEFVQRLRFHWVARIGEHYLYGPHLKIVGRKQGDLLNDWFNETYAASRYVQAYSTLFASSILTLGLFVLGARVNWRGTLILFVAGVLLVALVRKRLFGNAAELSARKILTLQGITSSMLENVTSIREIKLMRAETVRLRHLEQQTQDLSSILVRGAVIADLPRIIGEFLAVFSIMLFIAVSALLMSAQPQAVVPLLAFVFVLFYRLFTAGSQWMSARTRALTDVHSAQMVHDLAAQTVEYEDREKGAPISAIDTDIVFDGVTFSYDAGRSALVGVDAVIPKGRLTFLLGPSGSGKSTMLDLLLRLTEPGAGRIVANGQSAETFNLSQWRRCFGYVSQDVSLFNGSIRMNLLLARPEATAAEIAEACRLAGAEAFIEALPQGYDTVVGDRGHTLSGGQRKRIAIARALINRPSVLILDEATSAFEQDLEREVLLSIRESMPGLTLIQVTHRPQAAGDGDWVIALASGRVVATGPSSKVRDRAALLLA
jgi:ABC-type bacteriocin/lantibiotic exporter with double-glycine peptidase domain